MSNACMDEIFEIIGNHVIDQKLESKMPKIRADARKVLTKLGLDYKTIHSCPCDGILYYREYEDREVCPKCNLSRYQEDTLNKIVPRKVFIVNFHFLQNLCEVSYLYGCKLNLMLWIWCYEFDVHEQQKMYYFPITPRLQAMFRCPSISKLMTWHHDHKNKNDVMREPANSPAWKFAHRQWNFLQNPCSMFLGMAMDGLNSFGNNSSAYSIWPIVLTYYNLPPWLAIKASFLILAILSQVSHYFFCGHFKRKQREVWNEFVTIHFSLCKLYM